MIARYEVVTPSGFCVAVPERIWRAWPSGHRRFMEYEDDKARALDEKEATFNADYLVLPYEERVVSVPYENLSLRDIQGMYDHLGTMPFAYGSWSDSWRRVLSGVLHDLQENP